MDSSRKGDDSSLVDAARMLDIRPPEDEFRTLVRARMETLAKLGPAAGSNAARLDLYAEALDKGLAHLREARPR